MMVPRYVALPGSVAQLEAWPPFRADVPLARSYAEFDAMHRIPPNHVRDREDPDWKRANIVDCHGYGGRHPELLGLERFYVATHKDVEPYLREGWARACAVSPWAKRLIAAGTMRAGGYVYRKIRHKATNPLSPHGRGLAFDVRSDLNRGVDFKRGTAPKFGTPEWHRVWPDGMDAEFINGMLSVGFAWGGDWNESGDTGDEVWVDPMHFELIERSKPLAETPASLR